MTALEKKLQQEVIKNCEVAEKEYDCKMTRFLQTIERFGIVRTAQEILRKGRTSDCFNQLAEAGRLDLTMEATIIKSEYSELFTDEEVNDCYALLCERGYY
ncbi:MULTISPECIES: hypothetical protein [Turicibacter]|jgi:hypothetical protein|uniref:Uncharacterized protein n=2 Tax=Turicibacter sanguinis TaxID=154288 RepID=A0A173RJ76_9FIRM|nr:MULTISPECIES: hypothetical protein [Turicibacter]EFF62739.1 conserved hypothetical protein [Turicibacter sanguinis PC909]EGC92738.1 hypothetical protein HMPREF9402_2318 [Turicibacter sp. HGF1]MBP3903920.1 hypothetical protein [Turicibacter sp.]MCU7191318.1 hypothetical protein [Turicibacter sanguinis]MCU7197576.1 hypothetical protein [Turicibacter sanguinis]